MEPTELDALASGGTPLQVVAGDDLRTAERARAYADVQPGRIGLITDSTGLVSLALPQQSAADQLGLHEGAEVRITTASATERRPGGPSVVATPVGLGRRTGTPPTPQDLGDRP